MNPHRARVLAELGLVRYRLRVAPVASAFVQAVAASDSPIANTAALVASPALCVYAPEALAAPLDGPAATIWRQVLRWLRLTEAEVQWLRTPDAPSAVLPAVEEWARPEGKRALWLALKPFAAERVG